MSTATATDVEVLAGLDFEPICEAKTVFTSRINGQEEVIGEREGTCDNPAAVIVTIHNYTDHQYRQKYLCLDCLAAVAPKCYAGCGAPNVTSILTLGKQ